MPTETWNSDSRSSRPSGSSAVAASANGRKRGPSMRPRIARAAASDLTAAASSARELQRLRDVEAARDPLDAAPAASPRGLRDRAEPARQRASRPARSPARGRRAGRACRRRAWPRAPASAARTVKSERALGAPRRARPAPARCRRRGSGSASPSRPRSRSCPRPGRACRRRRKSMRAGAEVARRALARERRPASARGRWRSPARRARAASIGQRARCRSRRRARARRAGRPAASRAACARIRSRPARTVARMRPTGASEVSRAQASTAVRSK